MNPIFRILLISPDEKADALVQNVVTDLENTAVDVTNTFANGLTLLQEQSFDLMIIQDNVADQEGPAFVRKIRQAGIELPVIWRIGPVFFVITGDIETEPFDDNVTRSGVTGAQMFTYNAQNLQKAVENERAKISYPPPLIHFEDSEIVKRSPVLPDPSEAVEPVLLRLDTAVPERVMVDHAFDLAVAVRQPNSPVLNEPDLTRVDQGDIQIEWSEDQTSVRLLLEISAPDCEIEGEPKRRFKLFRGQDSPDFFFHLTPQKAGELSIIVTVYQEIDWLGSARVSTTAVAHLAGQVNTQTISQALTPDHLGRLHSNLINAFSMDELRALCLTLNINPEEIDGHGRTLSAFATGLITHCLHHKQINRLVIVCTEERPAIYWQLDKIPEQL